MKHLAQTAIEDLNPEFNSKMELLVKNVLEKAPVKTVLATANNKSEFYELTGASMSYELLALPYFISIRIVGTRVRESG